mgnify:CR=1 FL=1
MTDTVLPDARPDNWVDRLAPRPWRPWLKLGRFDRPVGIWLLMLPGWAGLSLAAAERGELPDWRLLLLFAVGAALMRAAGCAFNDIVDRDFDAKVARTASRPIPAGQISVRQAWGFLVACCLISFLILLALDGAAILLGVASLGLVAAYPFMKRITWWPQAWLGLTFNWGVLMGYAAAVGTPFTLYAEGSLGLALDWSFAPLLLYAALVFWTLGYDTIYAVQDLEDDALAGVKSSARRLGDKAPGGVAVFYLASCLLALGAWAAGGLGPLFFPPFALFVLHLGAQARRLRLDDPASALRLFKSNRDAGFLLVAALIAGAWTG